MTFLAPRVRSGKLGWFGFTSGIQAKDPGWAQPKLQSAKHSSAAAEDKRPIPAFLPSGLDGRRGTTRLRVMAAMAAPWEMSAADPAPPTGKTNDIP